MPQVVTNENMAQFIETRSVPEFVPPTAEAVATPDPAKTVDTPTGDEVERDPKTGQFVPKEGDDPAKAPPDGAAKETDDDLPERVRRQIGKKHREKMEAEEFARERDADAVRERLRADALDAELKALKGTKSGPTSTTGKPEAKDFKTVAEYADALADYLLDTKLKARDEKAAETRAKTEQTAAQAAFSERIAKAAKEIPDYAEVVGDSDLVVPPAMAQYIASEDMGPLIGYHLAKHPEELDRIAKLTPNRQIAELGKLEAKLETKPAPKPAAVPVVSRAPAPVTPLASEGVAVVQKDPKDMSFTELRAHRQAERAAGKRS